MHIGYAFIAACVVMLVSLSGVLFSAEMVRSWMHRNLPYLATFASGVFLLVVYHLLEETLHESSSLALASGAVLFGAAMMVALHHVLPAHHHHESAHDHPHTRIDGRRVLISDAFHNVGDGVLLVATFAVSIPVGLTAAVGIVLHELVQEISEFFVLKGSGYSTREALGFNLLSSGTILIGVALAAYLSSAEHIAVLFAGIAAGGFLTILIQDLLPNTLESVKKQGGGWTHVIAGLLGIALMLGVQTAFPHEEERGHAGEAATSAALQTPGISS
jgi:zinc and cadmium transporter